MDILKEITAAFKAPYATFALIQHPLCLLYLATSFTLVALLFLWTRRGRGRDLVAYLFPKRILLHPSALADYRFFIVGSVLMTLMGAYIYLSSDWLNLQVVKGLTAAFGPRVPAAPGLAARVVMTVLYVVLFDLGYWFNHWLMHKVPWLWEFHKAHHSAEVLTPLTSLRAHPYEKIQESNIVIVTTGCLYGAFSYLYGAAAHEFELWQVNILMFAYFMTVHNLRHSHFWLPIRGPLAHIIQSPAHHQVHHSTSKRHIDRNFGLCLSMWDWLFGTLYIPEKQQEEFSLGIGRESAEYHGVMALLFLPFIKIGRRIRKRLSAAK